MAILMVPNSRNSDWPEASDARGPSKHYCEQLELGHILLVTETPFPLKSDDRQFLLNVRQSSAQKACPKYYSTLAPNSTWLIYTDMVPHAVLFGQFGLEHTFIVPTSALLRPDCAPVHILESLAGVSLRHTTSLRPAA